jgi:cation transport ATPase
MNSSQVTTHMFNPFDGAMFLTGTVLMSTLGVIVSNNPVLAFFVAPVIAGLFMLAGKWLEFYLKSRADKRLNSARARIAELEAQLRQK